MSERITPEEVFKMSKLSRQLGYPYGLKPDVSLRLATQMEADEKRLASQESTIRMIRLFVRELKDALEQQGIKTDKDSNVGQAVWGLTTILREGGSNG